MELLKTIADLLTEAGRALEEFLSGLSEVEKERKTIVTEAFKKADEQTIARIKEKISHINE